METTIPGFAFVALIAVVFAALFGFALWRDGR